MVTHYAQDLGLSPRVILNRHDGVGLSPQFSERLTKVKSQHGTHRKSKTAQGIQQGLISNKTTATIKIKQKANKQINQ